MSDKEGKEMSAETSYFLHTHELLEFPRMTSLRTLTEGVDAQEDAFSESISSEARNEILQ